MTPEEADKKIEELGDKTPMEYADLSAMDGLARAGETGTARTIPLDMSSGSDIANLSVMGYDPHKYHLMNNFPVPGLFHLSILNFAVNHHSLAN